MVSRSRCFRPNLHTSVIASVAGRLKAQGRSPCERFSSLRLWPLNLCSQRAPMSHCHVCFSDIHPDELERRLQDTGIKAEHRDDQIPRALLADGTTDTKLRWLWVPPGHPKRDKVSWGITTSARPGHPNDDGPRIFLRGKPALLSRAARLILDLLTDPPQPAPSWTAPSGTTDPVEFY